MAKPMSLEEALIVAEQLSPMPSVAHEAMQVLVGELRRLQPHYEDFKPQPVPLAPGTFQTTHKGEHAIKVAPGKIFGGLPFITDPTLAPDEIAVVQGGKRVVFRLDMDKGTADVLREEPLP